MRKLRVCVLQSSYDGINSEFEGLNPFSAPETYDKAGKYEWHTEYIRKAASFKQIRALSRQGYDVFLNLCDGVEDEERAGIDVIQALERFGCVYTGADLVFLNDSKEHMKRMAYYYDLATPEWAVMRQVDMEVEATARGQVEEAVKGMRFPMIVKHPVGYNSVGMGRDSKCESVGELVKQVRKFVGLYGGALIEEFISGREFTVLVAENADDLQQPVTYLPVECVFSPGESFKHFDLKWRDYHCIQWRALGPEEAELEAGLRRAAQQAFRALGGCSYGRCDFRVDAQGGIYFLEMNPNCSIFYPPDAHGSADFILSLDPTTSHTRFIDHIIDLALKRAQRKKDAKTVEVLFRRGAGYGLHAARDFAPGEVVVSYEEQDFVLATRGHMQRSWPRDSPNWEWLGSYAYALTDDTWITWSNNPDRWKPINHCCDPNTMYRGLDHIARRHIAKGEPVTIEYATFCTDHMTAFDCSCGAACCRGRVTGRDYLLPEIRQRYGPNHVTDYVAAMWRRHDELQAQGATATAAVVVKPAEVANGVNSHKEGKGLEGQKEVTGLDGHKEGNGLASLSHSNGGSQLDEAGQDWKCPVH
mmetsp:Transcript_24454/g.53406  ORF Transcript_24454/g.53406 Transcript_24454/m.53406 type:complete len:587 (+) Transcript_24454:207-1967(+)|eukprot:CAMPEP_0202916010 /NCGR_PEP_ID=MMETSP1392-20130828/67407_1 /ASSEMBLY_ACC=CAM_ASM_000868 /TAXON_ID=225041 /ORGANISM="Chlamydomonas chlamydogama, Strain SAG 11-48b" /LENGTH=586 /DNA_ID=CAMNT_0049608255 /DNA_START=116 /DNA_END=1876 /DNA_ORIENTATION=-